MSESVIIALIGAGGAILAAVVAALISRPRHPRPASPQPEPNPTEEQSVSPADQLFQRLLRERHKISYIDAYEILVGPRPARGGIRYIVPK